jgi:methionyl-tRNA formyltransferase
MKLLFMGRKPAAAEALRWSVEHGFDVVGVLTDSHLSGSATASAARSLGIPVLDHDEVLRDVESGTLTFDVAVSFVYWRIIRDPLLSAPPCGIVNFHPAPLPAYRGTAGYNLAILDSLDEWAVTAHYMDAGIDTGGIIDAFRFSIDPHVETAQTLEAKSQDFMLALYRKTMRRIRQERVVPSARVEGGRYISRRQMEALKEVQPGDDIDAKIRAFWFPPYRGATVRVDGVPYTLVNEAILRSLAPPGHTSLQSPPDVRPSGAVPSGGEPR